MHIIKMGFLQVKNNKQIKFQQKKAMQINKKVGN